MGNDSDVTEQTSDVLRVRPREAARRLQMSARQLAYRTVSGDLKCIRDGRAVYYLTADLRRYARINHYGTRPKHTGKD